MTQLSPAATAAPPVAAQAARFVCRTAHQHEGGDHVIFVGQVLEFTHTGLSPLVFHGGRCGMVSQKQAAAPVGTEAAASSLTPDDLLYHVSDAYFRMRGAGLQELRRREWTGDDHATLGSLGRQDGLRLREIAAHGEARGRLAALEAVARLAGRGLVSTAAAKDPEGRVWLTPEGRQAVVEIIAIHKASEAHVLEGSSPGEVRLLKRLLRRLGDGPA